MFTVYVGCATVGAAAWWFMVYEEGPKLNYYQLVSSAFKHPYSLETCRSVESLKSHVFYSG